MLRYALRRVLWSIPSLIVTSLVLFFVTTLAPDPRSVGPVAGAPVDPVIEEARRARFLDLPRFVNSNPRDVRSRTRDALLRLATGDDGDGAALDLQRIGGAALPYALPVLETLSPEARGRVALALAPVAVRMNLAREGDLDRPEAAVLFWTRFWNDRALDFKRPAVERATARLVGHGSDLRERDLVELDTFALPELVAALTTTKDPVALERLTRIARHAREGGPVIRADAPASDVRHAVALWQEWWFVHATDFTAIDGAERVIAVVTETRYGKWLRRAANGELGVSAIDGEPIAEKLRARAPLTLLVCALAALVSWTLAVPIGALGAWRQGRAFDVVSSTVLFVTYAMPTFVVAELLRRASQAAGGGHAPVALAVVSLALGSIATMSRWQRAAMLEVLRQDFVRTAHAKGLRAWRVAVVHVLRNAWMPMVTLAGLHFPSLLGGAFVVEGVFGLQGAGLETLRAIDAHDTAWLMAVVLAAAVVVTAGLVVSDIGYGALDPRVREGLARRQSGRGP